MDEDHLDKVYDREGDDKTVVIEFTTDQAFSNINRMYRSNSPDPAAETEAIFDGKMAQVPANEVWTVTARIIV